MAAPTTLPDALEQIEELRGQVRELLRLLGQDAAPRATEVNGSPEKPTGAYEFSEGLIPKQGGKGIDQHLLDLHQMMETVPDIIFKLDLQGDLVGWNKRLETVTGFSPQELMGRSALAFVPEHEHAQTAAAIRRAFEEGYAELEGHLLTKDARTIPYHWTGAALKDEEGRVIGITGVGRDITDRKQAELVLQRSEAHFRALIEHSSDIITVLDLDGRIRFESPSFERLLGFAQHEIDGLIAFDFIHPDDLPAVLQKFQLVVQRPGEPQTAEFRFRHKDGSWLVLEGIGRSILDTEGQRCVIVNSRDATERKRTQEALTRSHDLLNSFVEHAPAAVAMLDKELRYVAVSRRWLQDYRLGKQDLIGRHHYDVFPEIRVMEEWQAIHRRCLGGAVERREEDRFVRTDGSEDWLRWEVRPWQEATGEIGGIMMFTEVITERKRAEQALRLSEERYARATAIGKVGVWELDVAGELYHADVNLKSLFGYGPDELSSDPYVWLGLVHPDDRPIAWEAWERVVSGLTDEYHYELRMIRKDGTIIWTDVRGHAERDQRGHVTRLFGATVDITERKVIQDSLVNKERELRTVLDALPIGVWFTDRQGQVLYGNPVGQQIWSGAVKVGLPDQHLGIHHWENIEATDLPHRWAIGSVLTKDQPVMNQMIEIETENGSRKTICNSAVQVRNDTGSIQGAIVLNEDITERIRTERALHHNHALLSAIMDAATDIIFVKDLQGRYVHINTAGARMLGMTVDDVIGWNDYALWPSDLAASCQIADRRVLETGKTVTIEETTTLSGKLTVFLTTKTPYRDPEGRIIGVIGVSRDITERKEAEETLRQSETRFRSLFENSPIAYQSLDQEGRFIDVNQRLCRLLGYEREELIGRGFGDLWADERQSNFPKTFASFQQTGKMRSELALRRRDGTIVNAVIDGRIQRDKDGQFLRTHCILTDITERKQAEDALRRSEARLNEAQQLAHLGSWELELTTNHLDWSDECYRIFELNRDQFGGSYEAFLSLVHPEDRETLDQAYTQSVLMKIPYAITHRLLMADGRVKYVQERCETFYDLTGTPLRSVGTVQDVTEATRLAQREATRLTQLQTLSELGLTLSGDPAEIFDRVVRMLGELFKVRVVCLSEIVGQELHFKAVYWNGQVVRDAGRCPLAVTPCASVQRDKEVHLFDRVLEQFPEATFLRDHNAVSYCGFPALDAQGQVVSVTCLLDDKPREFTAEEQALLRVFGQRIAVEIERSRLVARQKQDSENLRRSHAFIRQIIDTDPNFVFAKDRAGCFTLVNKAIADAYGTTVDNLIGKTDADFNPNRDEVDFFRLKDLEVMDSLRERFVPEEKITDAAGNVRWLQTVKRPILDETGQAVMVLGAATDITERKRMEEKLRRREHDLQQAVQERERISEDLHDGILQSIYAIGLGLEACKPLISDQPKKSAAKLKTEVQRTIGQLNHVLEEVRNFIAGLESHILDGQEFDVVLRTMVNSMAASYSIPARVTVEPAAAQHLSTEQAYHVMHIAREALSNSFRHSQAGRIRLSLRQLRRSVRLSVKDNGVGFNPTAARDVGHGLANMAARARKIGGTLTLQSKPRQGATVLVDIPRRLADVDN